MWEITTLLALLGGGITYSLAGYVKNASESWDWSKFGYTVALGLVLGFVAMATELPFDATMTYITGLGLIPLIENVWKAIYRRATGKKKK